MVARLILLILMFVCSTLSKISIAEAGSADEEAIIQQELVRSYGDGPIERADFANLACPSVDPNFFRYQLMGDGSEPGENFLQAYEAVYACSCYADGALVGQFGIEEMFCRATGTNPHADLVRDQFSRSQKCKTEYQNRYPTRAVTSCEATREVRISFLSHQCEGTDVVRGVFPTPQDPTAAAALQDLPSPINRQVKMDFTCKIDVINAAGDEVRVATQHSISVCHRQGHQTSEFNGLANAFCQAMRRVIPLRRPTDQRVLLSNTVDFPVLYFSGAGCVTDTIDVNLIIKGSGTVQGGDFDCNENGGKCSGKFCRYETQTPGVSAVHLPQLKALRRLPTDFIKYEGQQYMRAFMRGDSVYNSAISRHPTEQSFSPDNIFTFSETKQFELVVEGEPKTTIEVGVPTVAIIDKARGTLQASAELGIRKGETKELLISVTGYGFRLPSVEAPSGLTCSYLDYVGELFRVKCSVPWDHLEQRLVFKVRLSPAKKIKVVLNGEGRGKVEYFGMVADTPDRIVCQKDDAQPVECEIEPGNVTIAALPGSWISKLNIQGVDYTGQTNNTYLLQGVLSALGEGEAIFTVTFSLVPPPPVEDPYEIKCIRDPRIVNFLTSLSTLSTFTSDTTVKTMYTDDSLPICDYGGPIGDIDTTLYSTTEVFTEVETENTFVELIKTLE